MTAPILRQLAEIRDRVRTWRRAGDSIAVVPTMGALHAGHLSLVEQAKRDCSRVIVWIFVNPMQFNNAGDLDNYPRTEQQDAAKLAPYGVDVIYAPDVDQVYPDGFASTVSVSGLTQVMDGVFRPGHFDGVATVVSKIFLQTGADRAYFGEKDYQQLQVVRRMARDLDIPITVVPCPTVREASGLAMSSRNLRLSEPGRQQASALYPVLCDAAQALRDGGDVATVTAQAQDHLISAGFDRVEYFDLRRSDDLSALTALNDAPARLFVAAWIEDVRLIDNIAVTDGDG